MIPGNAKSRRFLATTARKLPVSPPMPSMIRDGADCALLILGREDRALHQAAEVRALSIHRSCQTSTNSPSTVGIAESSRAKSKRAEA